MIGASYMTMNNEFYNIVSEAVHFGYAGVMLLIMADGMQYIQNMRRRVFAIIAICAIYLLVDANLISVIYPIVSLKTMWMYYDHQAVVLLSAVLTFLNALNLFVFIYYMVEMILNQMSVKKRILSLNEELAQKNEQLLIQARQLEAATIFIKMGIDELSVSPGCILPVRKAIRDAE